MHVKAAVTQFFKLIDLPDQFVFVKFVVPGPERRGPVFVPGVFKILRGEFLFPFRIKHGSLLELMHIRQHIIVS
jgi:hypothetical protein